MIYDDLGMSARKKVKTHHLTDHQAAQRLARAPLFLQYLGMFKPRLIYSKDETVITLNDCNRGSLINHVGEGYEIPKDWEKTTTKYWTLQVMAAIGIC